MANKEALTGNQSTPPARIRAENRAVFDLRAWVPGIRRDAARKTYQQARVEYARNPGCPRAVVALARATARLAHWAARTPRCAVDVPALTDLIDAPLLRHLLEDAQHARVEVECEARNTQAGTPPVE